MFQHKFESAGNEKCRYNVQQLFEKDRYKNLLGDWSFCPEQNKFITNGNVGMKVVSLTSVGGIKLYYEG